jgi:hypothetical protein
MIRGPAALSDKDQDLWRRHLGAKAVADRPQEIWENSCVTVPGGDQQDILEILDFSDASPMYFDLGLAVASGSWWTVPKVEHEERAEAFVTPEVDGWTLVVSGWCYPAWDDEWYARTRDALRRLSDRFGVAWGFAGRGYGGTAAWACAKNGEIIWEREVTQNDDWGDADPTEGIDTDEPLGVNPIHLTEQTPVRGAGLRALTPYGRDAPRRVPGARVAVRRTASRRRAGECPCSPLARARGGRRRRRPGLRQAGRCRGCRRRTAARS